MKSTRPYQPRHRIITELLLFQYSTCEYLALIRFSDKCLGWHQCYTSENIHVRQELSSVKSTRWYQPRHRIITELLFIFQYCMLKAIKNATGSSVIFPISLIHFVFILTSVPNVGERFTKTLAQLHTSAKNFGENDKLFKFCGYHIKSWNFIQFQRASTAFHSNKKTVHKFTLLEGPKIYNLNFIFREISPKFEKSLKLQLSWII